MTENNENVSLINDDDFWKTMGVSQEAPKVDTPKVEVKEAPLKAEMSIQTETSAIPLSSTPVIRAVRFSPNDLPTINMESSLPPEYQATVYKILAIYATMPQIDYYNLDHEVRNKLNVKSEPTPDAQSINQLLERIQAAKDRLSEIMSDVSQNYTFKKRAVDILRDTWNKFSAAKSADMRKSEADHIVANFEMDLAYVESKLRAWDHIFKNLEGLHDNVSRRITIMQVCLKYSDIGRGMLPDFSFKTFSGGINTEENENKKPVDPTQGIEALEQDFRVR
jgi:hypothetical protein